MTGTCKACGAEFIFEAGRKMVYCSRQCFEERNVHTPVGNRFWDKVAKGDSCWLWIGAKDTFGYGRVMYSHSHTTRKSVWKRAHVVAWELTNGSIPLGLSVLHKCDVRDCVRPDHLYVGTQADNMRDMVTRKRYKTPGFKGEQLPQSKLNEAKVRAIRSRYATGGVTQQALADEHGVSLMSINNVIMMRTWKHVT